MHMGCLDQSSFPLLHAKPTVPGAIFNGEVSPGDGLYLFFTPNRWSASDALIGDVDPKPRLRATRKK